MSAISTEPNLVELGRWQVPRRLVGGEGRFGPIPQRLRKVFLDRDELPSASSLSDEIQATLMALARFHLSYTCGWQGRALDALDAARQR